MPIYPVLALAAAAVVVLLELRVLRTGLFREPVVLDRARHLSPVSWCWSTDG